MTYLDLTFPTPEENLACDEVLLDWCDESEGPEVLRFWEPQQHFVVVGYSNRVERGVNVVACREMRIPILRRCSGGGTVLQGPGCLNYSLVLRMDCDPALQTVTATNRFVMERNRAVVESLLTGMRGPNSPLKKGPGEGTGPTTHHDSRGNNAGRVPSRGEPDVFQRAAKQPLSSKSEIRNPKSEILVCGHTDLAIDGRKFSGNAQRRKRSAVLFHGTFLLNLDLTRVSELLSMPSNQPEYRQSRNHDEFLMNLNASASQVKAVLREAWDATETLKRYPIKGPHRLVEKKYSTDEWNLKR